MDNLILIYNLFPRPKKNLLMELIALDVFLWLSTFACDVFVEPVSRQMANAGYILWIVSQDDKLTI